MSHDVAQLESLLTDQPVNPLRPEQRKQYESELQRLGAIAQAPPYVQGDRGEAVKRYREIKRTVESQTAKPLDPDRASTVHALTKAVIQRTIQPAMLPQSVMRRNPAGAVDAFMKRENAPEVKRAVRAVKRALFALDPETDDIDHANLEKYRPSGLNPDGTATFMADAQIAGMFGQTPLAKANWPLGAPTARTALGEVQTRERVPNVAAGKRQLSPEERAALGARLKAGKERKRQAQIEGPREG